MARSNLHRVDKNRLMVSNDFDVDVSLFANADVPVEQIAVDELQRMLRVVTPVDLRRQDIKRRKDIVNKKLADLKQEAPFAYKGIGPVINTIRDAGIARPVAELKPIMTVKG